MWYKSLIVIILFLCGLLSPSFLDLYNQFNLPTWSISIFATSMYIPFWFFILKQKPNLIPLLVIGIFSYFYELLSINFGFPYGTFIYGDLMGGLKLFGQVPLTLPLIYVPMVVGATLISKELNLSKLKTIFLASFVLSLMDIVIDPSLTREGVWTWTGSLLGVSLYSVPIQNFLGWFLTSIVSVSIIYNLDIQKNYWAISGLTFTLFFWFGKSLQYEFWISVIVGIILFLSWYLKTICKTKRA